MQWYRLARELKIGTVEEIRARMSIDEFNHWAAFYEVLEEKKLM